MKGVPADDPLAQAAEMAQKITLLDLDTITPSCYIVLHCLRPDKSRPAGKLDGIGKHWSCGRKRVSRNSKRRAVYQAERCLAAGGHD